MTAPTATTPSATNGHRPAPAAAPAAPAAPPAAAFTIEPPARTATAVATGAAVAARTIRKFLRTPQLVVLSTVNAAMFLLIFRYVFGGAIATGGVPYVDFLVPGFVVTGLLFSGMTTAAGVAEDLSQGLFDRLRSLPVRRLALLTGRAVADTAVLAWGLGATVLVGFAVGFRVHGGALPALAALALAVVFGFALIWVFVWMGLVAGNAQAAQGMALWVFPFTFVSSALVPVASMPGWMQPVAAHQPVTAMVNAVRSLVLGDPALHWVVVSLLWSAAIVAVFAPLAVARYRRS